MRGRWPPILLGALVGGLCALAVGQWNMWRLRREQDAFQESVRGRLEKQRADDVARFAIASAAQSGLQAPAAASPAVAGGGPAAPPPTGSVMSDKAPSREEVWEGAQVTVRKHLADPVDSAWAARVTPALEHDVKQALAGTKANVGSLSCRSTSCLGTIDWPTLAEARNSVKDMMTGPMRVNCARMAMIPPDATNEAAPVRMDVLFDCSSWKATGSQIPEASPQAR